MATLTELKAERDKALLKAEENLRVFESTGHAPTGAAGIVIDQAIAHAARLSGDIDALEHQATRDIRKALEAKRKEIGNSPSGAPLTKWERASLEPIGGATEKMVPRTLSASYVDAFGDYLQSGGSHSRLSASLQEVTDAAGGYAVPVTVDNQIVPLAPTDCALRRLATVRKTNMDIKIPQFATFGTPLSSPVTEGSSFPENDPSLSQFVLSAFMVGSQRQISLELVQDVETFISEVVELDCAADQLVFEESLYLTGTGSGEPQGLINNVGAGVTQEPDSNSNTVCLAGARALIATLKSAYLSNASWLMSRSTALVMRASLILGSNSAYANEWKLGPDGRERFLGYAVEYSDAMPSAARGNAPILFGDFKRGYIIGDRGGSALKVKVLDQALATSGLVQVIAYRRTDGRVRRSEAIQQYNVAAS
jgi:HK97 family phage major capsid protein